MIQARALVVALALGASSLALAQEAAPQNADVELIVTGPPVEAHETDQPSLYLDPHQIALAGGGRAQKWSMIGREDFAAQSSDEYGASSCPISDPLTFGEAAILAVIVERARDTRVVILNESHSVTRHRDFARQVLGALRPLGYEWLAAETFANAGGEENDPVDQYADKPYPHEKLGYYSREPVFGAMLREAKALGYRFAAYEQVYDPGRDRPEDMDLVTAEREQEQAEHLAALLARIEPDEKLVIHAGYWHANESEKRRSDGFDRSLMAARLKRITGIDPLTIAQTECRGSAQVVRFSAATGRAKGGFDLIVDHPVDAFRHRRSEWRFGDGAQAIDIPEPYASATEPLIIEAFADGEPFEAVPVDRVWVQPGEDVKLALKPGRYTVRAVRPAALPDGN